MTIRSAIYLAGNKYKLWPQIKPHLESESRNTLVDVFGGSGTISLNAAEDEMFENIFYNEKAWFLYELQDFLKNGCDISWLRDLNKAYGKSQEEFLRLRKDYNQTKDAYLLFLLMCRSNSNMMRFNSANEYNMAWGDRTPFYEERVKLHINLSQRIRLFRKDFGDYLDTALKCQTLSNVAFYIDPPYTGTTATYNENGGWTQNDNTTLLEYCVELHNKGAKIVLSNVFENKDFVHQELIDWCETYKDKFEVHHLDMCYNNSSFRKGKGITDEVLIVSKS